MRFRLIFVFAAMLIATLSLSGCETSEERAEKYYQSGLSLLEEGDIPRALVEFRNVFKLNPKHKEARLTYARTQKERGEISDAYSQYLRVVEQYPDTPEARIELAEMAITGRNWEEAQRHGRAAAELTPEDERVKVIVTALDYAKARQEKNAVQSSVEAEKMAAMLEALPTNMIARRVMIDSLMEKGDTSTALPVLEEGLRQDPNIYEFYAMKLGILAKNNDSDRIGDTLKEMVRRFPKDEKLPGMLIQWYFSRNDLDGAEAYLRSIADLPGATQGAKLTVVEFLRQVKGNDAARAELKKLYNSTEDNTVYATLLASMDFSEGQQAEAIATLEKLTDGVEPSENINKARIVLARMLQSTDNPVGARSRIETVLADDPSNVEALKIRAGWLIDEDKAGEAIIDLRNALAGAPRDPSIMTLMGLAYERDGSRELAGERYALAVELSDRAPEVSLRYAQFLVADERVEAAESVLSDALEKAPNDVSLLQNMAGLHIRKGDWNRATQIIWKLRAMENEQATSIANGIEAEVLARQERTDEAISLLQGLINPEGKGDAALAALVQTQVRSGRIDEASKLVDEQLVKAPKDPLLRLLRAGLYFMQNDTVKAEVLYKELFEEFPSNERVLRAYYGLLIVAGREDEANTLIDTAIEKSPESNTALLLRAQRLEQTGDIDGAIAIYEAIYEKDTSNMLIANNLASLISSHRDDDENLARATAIARRLRGTDVPPLQDTYGWIAYRNGNFDEALTYLEPAAKGLPQDPLVQYHLGMTYLALERVAEARATLENAIQIAGEAPLPQIAKARETLENLPKQ